MPGTIRARTTHSVITTFNRSVGSLFSGAELEEFVGDGLMVLYKDELQYLQFPYEVIDTVGSYSLVTAKF